MTEVPDPDAVHEDACGQRVVGAGDGLRQLEAPAAIGKRLTILARGDLEELSRHRRAVVRLVPAKEHIRVELKRFIQKRTGGRPVIMPVVLQV